MNKAADLFSEGLTQAAKSILRNARGFTSIVIDHQGGRLTWTEKVHCSRNGRCKFHWSQSLPHYFLI